MFKEALDHCGFVDLGYSGPDFTWHGWRRGELIWERLDHGVANYKWVSRFPTARIQHLHYYTSDHGPILLSLNGNGEMQRWRRKPFRFESMWVANPGCKAVINEAWAEPVVGNPMFTATTKMKKCKMKLKKWSKESFGSIKNRIKETRERLWVAEETSVRSGAHQEVETIKKELNQLLQKEEKMWQQRSQVLWLENGDKNTNFFSWDATQRKRQNFIKGLRDEEGVWQNDEHIFSGLLVGFYEKLFASSNPQNMKRILNGVQEVVTNSMRTKLAQAYTMGKVEKAIKDMAPLKAPGPDGMLPLFYHIYWSDIGMDITQAVLSCLNSGSLLKSKNHTFITLIPKVKNPERVSEFRPISLCNVIYKIISKVLANHLKPILNDIISKSQNAFIADRLITDNVLIAFKSLHHMKTNCTGRTGFMALKLDMSKTYDKVEWCFLEKNLAEDGFLGVLGCYDYGVHYHDDLLYLG